MIAITRHIFCCLLLVLLFTQPARAQEHEDTSKEEVKKLSGISIVGNDDAPKVLYIVPWKSSEFSSGIVLDMPGGTDFTPVDMDEFQRKINYFNISSSSTAGR